MTVIDRMVARYNHEVASELDENVDPKHAARLSGLAVTNLVIAEMTNQRLSHVLSQVEQRQMDENIVANIFDFDALLKRLKVIEQYDDGRTIYEAVPVGEYRIISSETRNEVSELVVAIPQTEVGRGSGLIYERQIELAIPDPNAEYPLHIENSRLIGKMSLRHCAAVFPKTPDYVSEFGELVDIVFETATNTNSFSAASA